jgi:hypothetical protein
MTFSSWLIGMAGAFLSVIGIIYAVTGTDMYAAQHLLMTGVILVSVALK